MSRYLKPQQLNKKTLTHTQQSLSLWVFIQWLYFEKSLYKLSKNEEVEAEEYHFSLGCSSKHETHNFGNTSFIPTVAKYPRTAMAAAVEAVVAAEFPCRTQFCS